MQTSPKILLLSNKHNSLSQRIALHLKRRNLKVQIQEVQTEKCMIAAEQRERPDLIICPFLKSRIPEDLWSRKPSLIVHPGILGDRGASSLDWTLKDRRSEWGVTVLQAAEEYDHGPVWSTQNFAIDRPDVSTLTKSSLYGLEVTDTAVRCVDQAIDNFVNSVKPQTLDYSQAEVRGTFQRNMKRQDRMIDWNEEDEEVALRVRMSDSQPGAVVSLGLLGPDGQVSWDRPLRAFGAHLERGDFAKLKGEPGQVLGQRDGAILVKCGKGAMWLSHIKADKLKLPAMAWINRRNNSRDYVPLRVLGETEFSNSQVPLPHVSYGQTRNTFQEIWVTSTENGVCFINFDFYNGAMSTYQARKLEAVLRRVEQDHRCKVIVLKGGYNFFSNGINLNTIEGSADPVKESTNNINAINDVVRSIANSQKVTIAAIQGNAGAGGFMMSLAADLVVARRGVVLNPHYRRMHLTGSEYHSYFLPKRLGEAGANRLLEGAEPVLGECAADMGLVDQVLGKESPT